VYFLGRNSSGKTSVLRALSQFEYGKVPQEHPTFANYEAPSDKPLLTAHFSMDPPSGHTLSVDPLLDHVVQVLEKEAPLNIRK
jgi:hypothetical protein